MNFSSMRNEYIGGTYTYQISSHFFPLCLCAMKSPIFFDTKWIISNEIQLKFQFYYIRMHYFSIRFILIEWIFFKKNLFRFHLC